MVFSSITFLFYFFPIVLVLYFIAPRKFKNLILFLSSLVFYAWGEPIYIFIMLFSTFFDYFNGLFIEKFENKLFLKRLVLLISIVGNLGILAFFKYSDFFIANINAIGNFNIPLLYLPLPIGISFYTFQTMSYTIDVYKKEVPAQKNIISFGAYVTLFPQLIAGPIVRYKTIADQLNDRTHTVDKFSEGLTRFFTGLSKKVLLANNIGMLFDTVKVIPQGELSVLTAWIGIVAFAFQIYFDFSGYSDMAIGLGKMFGFDFLENFNYPYISQNITEFWRRWHISLGTWFKEYVYIPLGGNRVKIKRMYFNILVVWILTGFWHGATWNFIFWGLYYGIILMIEKTFMLKVLEKLPKILRHIYSLLLILIGWVLFAFDSLALGLNYLKTMFGIGAKSFIDNTFIYSLVSYLPILIILAFVSTPLPKKYFNKFLVDKNKFIAPIFIAIGFVLCVAYLVDSTYNPFLYFRF